MKRFVYENGKVAILNTRSRQPFDNPAAYLDNVLFHSDLEYFFIQERLSLSNVSFGAIQNVVVAITQSNCGKCLPATARIMMVSGIEIAVKDLKVGDAVMSFDEHGTMQRGEVAAIQQSLDRPIFIMFHEHGEVKATDTHVFQIFDKETRALVWKSVSNIVEGDCFITVSGERSKITNKSLHGDAPITFDFEVTPHHTYICDGVRTHNGLLGDITNALGLTSCNTWVTYESLPYTGSVAHYIGQFQDPTPSPTIAFFTFESKRYQIIGAPCYASGACMRTATIQQGANGIIYLLEGYQGYAAGIPAQSVTNLDVIKFGMTPNIEPAYANKALYIDGGRFIAGQGKLDSNAKYVMQTSNPYYQLVTGKMDFTPMFNELTATMDEFYSPLTSVGVETT